MLINNKQTLFRKEEHAVLLHLLCNLVLAVSGKVQAHFSSRLKISIFHRHKNPDICQALVFVCFFQLHIKIHKYLKNS